MQIKNLAAELCLDRAVVLELLRDPPPNLLIMSAALPDEPAPTVSVSVPEPEPEPEPMETTHSEPSVDTAEPRTKEQVPVHVMQHTWSAQKRLKKVQVETLERVYSRTKRPTVSLYIYFFWVPFASILQFSVGRIFLFISNKNICLLLTERKG